MIVYDQTTIAFIQRTQELLKDILRNLSIEVRRSRFLYRGYLYPITVVVFEGKEFGHFNAPYFQIGLNKKLIYSAKDSVLRDILKHELAHYLTHIEFGAVSPHGEEFKSVCERFGFPQEVAAATMNLDEANLNKEGDLTSERILEKVKKLLQLAQSSNAHEAELATMKANALLLRHNLDQFQSSAEEEALYLDRVLIQKRKDAKITAISDILQHFLVKTVFSMGKNSCTLEVFGTLTNVKLAKYVAEFLNRELDHLWEVSKKEHALQGLRAKNSFFLGVAKGFEQKMKTSAQSFSGSEQKALTVVKKDLDVKVRKIYSRLTSTYSGSRLDEHAAGLGVQKGKNLSIRQGVETSSKNLYLSHSKT